jgi:hypothetical protein
MRKVLLCAAAALLVASPCFAGEKALSKTTLDSLGLGGLELLSDADGLQVRGMSAEAFSFGASSLFGQLSDPGNPGNFVTASDINGSRASDENAGLGADALTTQGPQGSSIATQLDVIGTSSNFTGTILGNAGNASNIGAAGISAGTGN